MGPSNVSSVVNYFATPNEGFTTTLGSTIAAGATSVPVASVANLTNGSIFVGIIEPSQTNEQVFTGIVNTATSTITNVVWTRGTNVTHNDGVQIVDYVTGTAIKMLTTGILKEHLQSGAHGNITTQSITNAGALTNNAAINANAGLNASAINLIGSLTGTGLANQLQTYTPTVGSVSAGSNAGGLASYYINLAGIKIAWINIYFSNNSGGTGIQHVQNCTLPSSFFTTIQYFVPGIQNEGNAAGQYVSGDGVQSGTTSFNFYISNSFNNSGCTVSSLIIGT